MERMKKKGFIFSMDAFFAIALFVLVTVGVYAYFINFYSLQQQWYMSEDLMNTFSRTKIEELDLVSGIYPEIESIKEQESSFKKCRNIAITNVKAVTLQDFPAYLVLNYDSDMKQNFDDLRFKDKPCNDGGEILYYEIDSYEQGIKANLWVKLPIFSSAGTTISVYYGNPDAVSGQNPDRVWDDYFGFVSHMGDNPQTQSMISDSTQYENSGIKKSAGEPLQSSGKIGNSQEYDGSNDKITVAGSDSLNSLNQITIEAWVYPETMGEGGSGRIISKSSGFSAWVSSNDLVFELGRWSENSGQWATNADVLVPNFWNHVVLAYDYSSLSNKPTIYVNGDAKAIITIKNPAGLKNEDLNDAAIGNELGETNTFDGKIDEMRISSIMRGSNWVKQAYDMVNAQASCVVVGGEVPSTEIIQILNPELTIMEQLGVLIEESEINARILTEDLVNPLKGERFGLNITIEDMLTQEVKSNVYDKSDESSRKLGLASTQRYILRRK
jgi:hypothetical protein